MGGVPLPVPENNGGESGFSQSTIGCVTGYGSENGSLPVRMDCLQFHFEWMPHLIIFGHIIIFAIGV